MRNRGLWIAVASGLLLTACGSAGSSSSPSESATPLPPLPAVWSFTGLPGPIDALSKPVMVVKIENDPVVRPQTGLNSADMVFEELVEGGITRFAAIYQSDIPKAIGPVRSIRHVDAAIASPIADIFVFSGGAPKTMRFVEQKVPASISVVTEGGIGMSRNSKHAPPHNVWLNPGKLIDSIADNKSPSFGFFANENSDLYNPPEIVPIVTDSPVSSPSESPSGTQSPLVSIPEPVAKVSIEFSQWENPVWTWSEATNLWLRSERKKPFENIDGTQFGVDNLVVLSIRTIDAGYKDPAGNYVPRSVLTGTGTGYLLSNGSSQKILWSKERVADIMTLTDEYGNRVTLPTGKTWVSLLPNDEGKIDFTAPKAQ
ncbi:MAG: DUF3048 domain-containing protein [Actinobacteria bacterium]|uniref:Unannotated protein n=1 Tax=freshwater metagenome TaxID=449393 RepID=A0A6J5ZHV4_9ZZZZ|nr:DUF3048 domain-containing protein [Actinomycetota bacterium]